MASKVIFRLDGPEAGSSGFRVRDNSGTIEVSFDGGTTWVTATGFNNINDLTVDLGTLAATAAELNKSSDVSGWAVVDPGADASLTAASHGTRGRPVLLSSATGDTFTLPAAAGTGVRITVIVSTTATSNNHIIQCANATDEYLGIIYQVDSDSADALAAYPALDADGFDTITMNGSTKGGIKGDRFDFIDVAAGHWNMFGSITSTGTVASPLSAAV